MGKEVNCEIYFPNGEKVEVSEVNLVEDIFIPEYETYKKINFDPIEIHGIFECTYINKKALRKLFKLPRKLKKKVYGTRSSKRRNI